MAAVQEVEGEEGDKRSFEVLKPSRRETSECKLEGVNEGRFHVAEREVEGRGMSSYFGAKVDIGEWTVGSELDVMVDEGAERGDEEIGVVVELRVSRDGA